MPFATGKVVPRAYITHKGDWDTLLVRVGHHLWAWAKSANARYEHKEARWLEEAWLAVVAAKAEYRKPMIAQREVNRSLIGRRRMSKNPVIR